MEEDDGSENDEIDKELQGEGGFKLAYYSH